MPKYSSTFQFKSKLPEYSEVTITLKRFSHGLRAAIRTELARALGLIRDKTDAISEVLETSGLADGVPGTEPDDSGITLVEMDGAGEPVAKAPGKEVEITNAQLRVIEHIGDINESINVLVAKEVDPLYLQYGFVSIVGPEGDPFEIDGVLDKKIGWKLLYEQGPEELCKEIVAEVKKLAGLSQEAKENLGLPITSGAVADGQTSDTTAPAVSETSGMQLVTAGSSSQSE